MVKQQISTTKQNGHTYLWKNQLVCGTLWSQSWSTWQKPECSHFVGNTDRMATKTLTRPAKSYTYQLPAW